MNVTCNKQCLYATTTKNYSRFKNWTNSAIISWNIQTWTSQVWNCDEIGFDPNGSWRKVVFTYRLFTGDRMWRNQNVDISPFWCTYLSFYGAYGQWFMPTVIFNQAEKYTQDLHYNIPKYWVVHNTSSGYMDRDGWMKAMMHCMNACWVNKLNPQVLFYDGHEIHFESRDINIIRSHHTKHFTLKAGDSGNDHQNNNGPNINLNGIYCQSRMNWQRQYVTIKFTNTHMNYVLVETWRASYLYSDPIIINAFKKTNIVLLTQPD